MSGQDRHTLLKNLLQILESYPGSVSVHIQFADGTTSNMYLPPLGPPARHGRPEGAPPEAPAEDFGDVHGLAGAILRVVTPVPAPAKVLAKKLKRPCNSHFYKALRFLMSQDPPKVVKVHGGFRLP
jgi:hypothetical protein